MFNMSEEYNIELLQKNMIVKPIKVKVLMQGGFYEYCIFSAYISKTNNNKMVSVGTITIDDNDNNHIDIIEVVIDGYNKQAFIFPNNRLSNEVKDKYHTYITALKNFAVLNSLYLWCNYKKNESSTDLMIPEYTEIRIPLVKNPIYALEVNFNPEYMINDYFFHTGSNIIDNIMLEIVLEHSLKENV
jgi:hypothetical protein